MDTPQGTRKWLFYTFLGMIADALDVILTSVIPDKTPQRSIVPSDVDQLSDEKILELKKKGSKLDPAASVFKLTPGTVTKASQDLDEDAADASEANALDLLFAKTTIPVPRVRRVVKRQRDFLIVMDYIPGPTLAHVWPTLSMWRKIRVAFTLRRYVRQLRRLKAPATTPPGPLSAQGARRCESPIFGQVQSDRGPFATYSELSAFFNERHQMAMNCKKLPRDDLSRNDLFDNSEPMWRQNDERVSGTNDEFWKALIPCICGPYFRQEKWLWRMGLGLYYK